MDVKLLTVEDLSNPFLAKQISRYGSEEVSVLDIIAMSLDKGDKSFLIEDNGRVVGLIGAMANVQPKEWLIQYAVGNYEEFPKDTATRILGLIGGGVITTSGAQDDSNGFAKSIGMVTTGNIYISDTRSLRTGPVIADYIKLDKETFDAMSPVECERVFELIDAGIVEESQFDQLSRGYDIPAIIEGIVSGFKSGDALGAAICIDSKVAGLVIARKDNNESFSIQGMYVMPEHRLNNIGANLIRAIAQVYGSFETVRAGVLTGNLASIAVFEKLGFSKEQTLYHAAGN